MTKIELQQMEFRFWHISGGKYRLTIFDADGVTTNHYIFLKEAESFNKSIDFMRLDDI